MTDQLFAAPGGRSAALGASQPRYLQLAQTLLHEIESGKYAVGTQLPTEFELCDQFGVSRDFPFGAAVSLVLTLVTLLGSLALRGRSAPESILP